MVKCHGYGEVAAVMAKWWCYGEVAVMVKWRRL